MLCSTQCIPMERLGANKLLQEIRRTSDKACQHSEKVKHESEYQTIGHSADSHLHSTQARSWIHNNPNVPRYPPAHTAEEERAPGFSNVIITRVPMMPRIRFSKYSILCRFSPSTLHILAPTFKSDQYAGLSKRSCHDWENKYHSVDGEEKRHRN